MQQGMRGGWFQLLLYFATFIHLCSFKWRLNCQHSEGANSQGDNGVPASRFLIFRGLRRRKVQLEAMRKQAVTVTHKDLHRMIVIKPWKGARIEGAAGGRGGVKAETGNHKKEIGLGGFLRPEETADSFDS
ncbi:hypothetical protein BT69DRAFT_1304488 [Atractiella rhizophila]|nr:hypothetical protein BT69DRAFT_1304488 [Atractiella rhizophila]